MQTLTTIFTWSAIVFAAYMGVMALTAGTFA
jgi:hypothetical protein